MSGPNEIDDGVRRLLREAGPRPSLPEEDLAAIRDAARAVWREQYGHRRPGRPGRPGRWPIGLAAAAALAVALGLIWWGRKTEPPPAAPVVASIEVLDGPVRIGGVDGAVGQSLPAGTELETGAGRAALRMAGGASVRFDRDTKVRLTAAGRIELTRGAVYVDSGARPGGKVAIRTAAGLFQEMGTQFEVRIEAGAAARLRVREGRVSLEREKGPVLAQVGEELLVPADGEVVRRPIAAYGPEWDWVVQAAPRLDIEGVKVRVFLDWLARETGRHLEFADPETADLAGSTVLHGSIEHLPPAGAADAVLASCGLGSRIEQGRLVIFSF